MPSVALCFVFVRRSLLGEHVEFERPNTAGILQLELEKAAGQ